VSIETTSPAVYRSILASSDRISLFSKLEAEQTDAEVSPLLQLPFDSSVLSRTDGMATRTDWQPTRVHREFLDLLREETRPLRTGSPARQSRNRPGRPPRRRAKGSVSFRAS